MNKENNDSKRTEDTMHDLDELRVTEWLKPESVCGATGFKNCTTNRGWLMNEIQRIKNKRINAVIVRHNGMMAIFRPRVGEMASDIERKLKELDPGTTK